jgi:uncharacterized protein
LGGKDLRRKNYNFIRHALRSRDVVYDSGPPDPHVKFQPDRLDGVNAITAFDRSGVRVNAQRHETSVLVPWQGAVLPWGCNAFAELNAGHFEQVLGLKPELVIFGSGDRLRFPAAALIRSLIAQRIGVETMDTGAACRTYNVLAAEGRAVVAALLLERAATP